MASDRDRRADALDGHRPGLGCRRSPRPPRAFRSSPGSRRHRPAPRRGRRRGRRSRCSRRPCAWPRRCAARSGRTGRTRSSSDARAGRAGWRPPHRPRPGSGERDEDAVTGGVDDPATALVRPESGASRRASASNPAQASSPRASARFVEPTMSVNMKAWRAVCGRACRVCGLTPVALRRVDVGGRAERAERVERRLGLEVGVGVVPAGPQDAGQERPSPGDLVRGADLAPAGDPGAGRGPPRSGRRRRQPPGRA